MADLMDFTEEEVEDNRYVRADEDKDDDGDDPNVIQTAPRLAQSPVIVNSILKQSTKDNLIQLYTPHQKPEKGKLKVHFGPDSLLQTPTVKQLKTRNTENDGVKFEENGKENSPKTPVMGIDGKNKQIGKKILDNILDQVPENECTEKGPTSALLADERLEESAMEISIYESQSEQPLQTIDSTEDILRQAELLLLSLKGDSAEPASQVVESEHCKAENQSDDSLKDGTKKAILKTDTPIKQEISETCINEKKLETKIKEEPGIKEPVVQDEGQASLLNAEEKSGCTDSTTGKIFINQENDEVNQKVNEFSKNEEEPMDYEEKMDVDDEDSEIVFNIGKNKESNVEDSIEQTVEKESQNEDKSAENEKMDEPQGANNSKEIVKDNVEEIASTNEQSSGEVHKTNSAASQKSKESEEIGKIKGKETTDSTEKDKESPQKHNDDNKTTDVKEDSLKPESKKSGDESSDEEFLSADEDMDDNKVKTPTKPESQETGKSNKNPLSDSPERTPPKVGYNLDFDDLEAMDPFATKQSLMNSPAINQPSQKDGEKKTGTKVQAKKVPKGNLKGNKENSNQPADKSKVEGSSASATPAKIQESKKTVSNNDSNKESNSKPEKVQVDVVDDKTKETVKDNTPSKSIENVKAVPTKSNEELEQNKVVDLNNKVETMEEATGKGTPQKTNTEEVTAVAEDCITSPPLPATKGVYNLDALELDNVYPFKPKKQMMNSPVRNPDTAAVVEDPFKTNSQIQNSPVTKTESQKKLSMDKPKPDVENKESAPSEMVENKKAAPSSEVESKTDVSLNKADENKSKSKKDMPSNENESKKDLPLNEVESKKDVSSNNETGEIAKDKKKPNEEEEEKNQNPKTSKLVKKKTLPKKSVEEMSSNLQGESDPFKPKSQIQNSPAIKKKVQNEINDGENLDEVDPFKPKSQIMNSPDSKPEQKVKDEVVDNFDEIDPFKSKTKVANSPVTKKADNPTEGKEDTDSTNFDDIDPFKPKKQMQNSPVKTTTETKDDKSDEVEPVYNAKEIQNSPVKEETKTEMKTLDMLGSENFDDIDPFKPKMQMQNSPVTKNVNSDNASNNEDKTLTGGDHTELSESKQNESADTKEKKKDKTKKETGKNKNAEQKVDPFADLNPFQTKSKAASSLAKAEKNVADSTDDVNPFKSNSQIANSPEIQCRGDDPFVTKSRMANTPIKAEEEDDPFKQKFELPTTPTNDGVSEEADDIFEVQGITRRGQASTQDQFGNIDESEFVPASEVFNDPAAWEMLEKMGGGGTSADSALSRMSLYVKFDPLVSASNPRRISIKMSQLEKVKEYGLDDTLLLLGTPPKKKRQSMTASQFKITPSGTRSMREMQAKGPPPAAKNTEPAAITPGAVDLILACSPSEREQPVIPKAGMKTRPVLSLLDAAANNEDNLVQELKYTNEDLIAVRREMELVTQGLLLKKEQEWCQEKKRLEGEKAELIKKYQQIKTDKDKEKTDKEKIEVAFLNLEQLVNEIAAAREAADKKVLDVMAEKNQLLQDIREVENSFADLHKRYEKARNVVLSQQKNEETLKKFATDKVNDLKKMEEKSRSVEKSLNEKLAAKSQEIEKLRMENVSVQSKLDAQTKIMQMKIDNLETSLKTKIEENKQLTEICDNLLAKVQ